MNFEGLNKGIPSEVVFVCKKPLKSDFNNYLA